MVLNFQKCLTFFEYKVIKLKIFGLFLYEHLKYLIILDSERKVMNVGIDFTMIITSRNNALISNFGGGFRCKKLKSKHFPTVFKKIEKNQKKIKEKREFIRKTSFRPNRFFYMVVILKLITTNT
ncbi:Uncharacterized protein FWK35_00009192 [Aphis craccivora]|uniref:Uncharacterized protein n=1 Tax=Aphis craccivora TaxID=307492 RepID=A0A6G0YLN4_APHCR|nr:Uncharacterized protein FWK35_00009192 [Aphis craccivora]